MVLVFLFRDGLVHVLHHDFAADLLGGLLVWLGLDLVQHGLVKAAETGEVCCGHSVMWKVEAVVVSQVAGMGHYLILLLQGLVENTLQVLVRHLVHVEVLDERILCLRSYTFIFYSHAPNKCLDGGMGALTASTQLEIAGLNGLIVEATVVNQRNLMEIRLAFLASESAFILESVVVLVVLVLVVVHLIGVVLIMPKLGNVRDR